MAVDWIYFTTVFLLSCIGVICWFEWAQTVSVRRGNIPARGIHQWKGKPFLHWDHFAAQKYGDTICLSALNAFVIPNMQFDGMSFLHTMYLILLAHMGLAAFILWERPVSAAFREGKFSRWDWGYATTDGAMTFAGRMHGMYFAFEAAIILMTFGYFVWQDMPNIARIGAILSLIGYGVTCFIDSHRIGLGGGRHA